MTERDFSYPKARPELTIEITGGKNLGNCYNAVYYKVTSLRPLDEAKIISLRSAGFLGCGQGFIYKSRNFGIEKLSEEPAGFDEVECVEYVNGVAQPGPAINPYSGKPYPPTKYKYFVYEFEDRIDSGD